MKTAVLVLVNKYGQFERIAKIAIPMGENGSNLLIGDRFLNSMKLNGKQFYVLELYYGEQKTMRETMLLPVELSIGDKIGHSLEKVYIEEIYDADLLKELLG